MARFLRSNKSQNIGVMLFDATDPFCTPIVRGIENALILQAQLPSDISGDTQNNRERFERYLEMLAQAAQSMQRLNRRRKLGSSVDIHVLADLNKREIPAATIGWKLTQDHISSSDGGQSSGKDGWPLNTSILWAMRNIAFSFEGLKRLIDSGPRWRGI